MAAPRFSAPSECPVCGATVPLDAKACPDCGADERSGWNEELTAYDGMDLPDSAFAESGNEPSKKSGTAKNVILTIVAIGLLAALLLRLL